MAVGVLKLIEDSSLIPRTLLSEGRAKNEEVDLIEESQEDQNNITLNSRVIKRRLMIKNVNKISIIEVRNRIIEILYRMSEGESRKLLKGLEKWEQSKSADKREHPRKNTSIYAICQTDNNHFRDFTNNVSAGGAFIKTETSLSVNEDIFTTFLHDRFRSPVRASGKIVRIEPKGVGIKFNQIINDI